MPYDTSLDAELFSKSFDNDAGKIIVSVHSYRNGPKKMQIVREIKNRDGELTFAKLGRLAKDEVEGVIPLIQEALKSM